MVDRFQSVKYGDMPELSGRQNDNASIVFHGISVMARLKFVKINIFLTQRVALP